MKILTQLIEHGQSYWMDNLSRSMIENGELRTRVQEQGLRGITSNPTIFDKAISGSNDYDKQIQQLVEENKDVHEIYEALTIKDVQDACDILKPAFDESDGVDGFVSLEVSPYLAHDTEGTMNEVRRLFKAVSRPNVFIKIPGTPAGVPAIEQMLYEGININITLLFSIDSYEEVVQAYIRALERRMNDNKPVETPASVASFFLSRIDVLVDQLLGHRIKSEQTHNGALRAEQLLGKVAVANAKLAYQSFKSNFSGERWQRLEDKGARVQRPLWASTSVKNPLYRDVKYVEPLIGPNTVNTMPGKTITAFAEHGTITDNSIHQDISEAMQVFSDLDEIGVDIEFVTRQLVNEGVQKFIDPYDNLMTTLARNREEILADKSVQQHINYGEAESDVRSAYDELDSQQLGRRLYAKDPLLWSSSSEQKKAILNRLGWLDCIETFADEVSDIVAFAREVKESYNHVLLLGMGGSSQPAQVALQSLPAQDDWPRLIVLDKTDPKAIRSLENLIDPTSTLFIVASKSGTTSETINFYKYFLKKMEKHFQDKAGEHFIAITDPDTPLMEEARNRGFRRVFKNPENIGGRYSPLSYFGLVPMALCGIDIAKLLESARQMRVSCGPFVPAEGNPGVSLGALLGMAYRSGRDKITFLQSETLNSFAYWVEQLLAESTGKEGMGLVPVINEPLGAPEVYSDDRILIYMETKEDSDPDLEDKLKKLERAGHPVVRIVLADTMQVGAAFFHWQIATATAAAVMGINPFDEPNVTESKTNTKDLLSRWAKTREFLEGNRVLQDNNIGIYCADSPEWLSRVNDKSLDLFLNSFVELIDDHNYVGLLPFFIQTQETDKQLQELRELIRDKHKVATTVGYGPGYLHSTGQLHKGGPNTGLYLIFTAEPKETIEIPGQEFDFATLQHAQMLGDLQSLKDKNRRVVRIHLGGDIDAALRQINEILR